MVNCSTAFTIRNLEMEKPSLCQAPRATRVEGKSEATVLQKDVALSNVDVSQILPFSLGASDPSQLCAVRLGTHRLKEELYSQCSMKNLEVSYHFRRKQEYGLLNPWHSSKFQQGYCAS